VRRPVAGHDAAERIDEVDDVGQAKTLDLPGDARGILVA
jgi:hypothetical protein